MRNRRRGETEWGGPEGKAKRAREVGDSEEWDPEDRLQRKAYVLWLLCGDHEGRK